MPFLFFQHNKPKIDIFAEHLFTIYFRIFILIVHLVLTEEGLKVLVSNMNKLSDANMLRKDIIRTRVRNTCLQWKLYRLALQTLASESCQNFIGLLINSFLQSWHSLTSHNIYLCSKYEYQLTFYFQLILSSKMRCPSHHKLSTGHPFHLTCFRL